MVIGESLTGYEPRAVTAPNTYKPHADHLSSQLPFSRAKNSSSGASGKCGGWRFQGPFLYILLRVFLLEIEY